MDAERKMPCSYLAKPEVTKSHAPKVEGRGFKGTKPWNDTMSQLSDSGDETQNPNRSGETAHSRKISHRSAATVRRTGNYRNNYNYSIGHYGDSNRIQMKHLSSKTYNADIHDVRSSTDSLLLPLDHHSLVELDTSSIVVHATESVAGDIDTRSVSSLHLLSSVTHMDHDIMIHVEYPESTGSITSDHKESESMEHSYYTSTMSRGRAESFGYPSDRSAAHPGNSAPVADQDYFPSTMSYKSDLATVCSGSVTEDIEISSVLSSEMGNLPSLNRLTSQVSLVEGDKKIKRNYSYSTLQKHDRSVEFSLDAWGNPAQRLPHQNTDSFFQSFPRLNTMGPPLNRSMLLSAVLTGDGQSSFEAGGSSRPGSVRSFASDNVFVDADDCGGSIVGSDGRASVVDEHHSVHSHDEHVHSNGDMDECNKLDKDRPEPTDLGQLHNLLLEQGINGRVSPGGTIYKGRGVRKYQGRYMNLPLKRFYQSTDSITQIDDYCSADLSSHLVGGMQSNRDRRTTERPVSPRNDRSRRSYRTRSRSRSRDRGESNVNTRNLRRRSRSHSCSPPPATDERDFEQQRLNTRNSGGYGWKRKKDNKVGYRSHHLKNGTKYERNNNEGDSSGRGWGHERNKGR
jgi:hypothetical protein